MSNLSTGVSTTGASGVSCDTTAKGYQGLTPQTTYNTGDRIGISWLPGMAYTENLTIECSLYLKRYRDDSQNLFNKIAMFEDRTLKVQPDWVNPSSTSEPVFARVNSACNITTVSYTWTIPNDIKFSGGDPNFVIHMENYTTARGFHEALVSDSLPFLINGVGEERPSNDSSAQDSQHATNNVLAIGIGAAFGVTVMLLLVLGGVWFRRRQNRKRVNGGEEGGSRRSELAGEGEYNIEPQELEAVVPVRELESPNQPTELETRAAREVDCQSPTLMKSTRSSITFVCESPRENFQDREMKAA